MFSIETERSLAATEPLRSGGKMETVGKTFRLSMWRRVRCHQVDIV